LYYYIILYYIIISDFRVNLRAKFEVYSFNTSEFMEGSQNLKIGHVIPSWPFDLIFHLLVCAYGGQSACWNWSFWLPTLPRYGGIPKIQY